MVATARRRDPRDGRTLRKVDGSFWACLATYVQSPAEECRYLEYQIQSIRASLARTGTDTEAHSELARRLDSEPPSDRSKCFKDWLANNQEFKTLMLSHQTEAATGHGGDDYGGSGAAAVVAGGKYKCCELGCKHYVYGFETHEALRWHMELHEEDEGARREEGEERGVDDNADRCGDGVSREGKRGVGCRRKGSVVVGNGNGNGNGLGGAIPTSPLLKGVPLMPTPDAEGRRRGGERLSLPAGAGSGVVSMKTAKPCLRCKVLKKKCDYQNPCKECPQQDVMAPDLWKALGCFHGPLTEMVRKCFHGFESTPQSFSRPTAGTDDIFWTSELDYLMTNYPDFVALSDDLWNSRQKLTINSAVVMNTTPNLTDAAYRILLRDYGSAVGLLKTTHVDGAYFGPTAYNPFALLRVGKEAMAACDDPPSWHLYTLAHTLLITVIRYRLALTSTPPTTPPSLTAPLTNFLLAFDTRFTNRKKLPPSAWLAAFHSLCLFSITKTLLIDTPTPHQSSPNDAAARLATAHKILVSLFAWSAILSAWCPENPLKPRDPLLTDWTHESNPAVPLPIRAALTETRRLVNRDGRAKSYTLHTKNFLLGLGAGNVEGGFNGFLTMRYGGAEAGYRGW